MVLNLSEISGIEGYTKKTDTDKDNKPRMLYFRGDKVFLVDNEKTLEVRTDEKLAENLKEKYETVMESRYFGRGGIEIVPAGQLTEDEIKDLVRLSYDLTK